jgi:hypothetical protein
MTTTHAMASAISYARRYLLSMVFSLCVEKDDDGNAAGRVHHKPANDAREAFLRATRERIRKATDWHELGTWWNSQEQKKARRDFDLTAEEVADLVAFVTARLAQLRQPQAAA